MAEALIKGILSSKTVIAPKVLVAEAAPERRGYLESKYQVSVSGDNRSVAAGSEVLILAVKPQVVPTVLEEIKGAQINLLVSIAAGITIGFYKEHLPDVPVIRVMPNNPALVGAGITAIARGRDVTGDSLKKASNIFKAVGEIVMVEEKDMDAVTGLSGSGPAYVYLMIEALTEGGQALGLDRQAAQKLAVETVFGAAKTMRETGRPAQELREMVTSPGGTTVEGLKVLEKKKFKQAVIEAVKAAAKKSKKLSK